MTGKLLAIGGPAHGTYLAVPAGQDRVLVPEITPIEWATEEASLLPTPTAAHGYRVEELALNEPGNPDRKWRAMLVSESLPGGINQAYPMLIDILLARFIKDQD